MNNILRRLHDAMQGYRLPRGVVNINIDDTGAIIAIILYFIAKEPTISRDKLEAYILLLDKIYYYQDNRHEHMFQWHLTDKGRIGRFINFEHFMIERQLLVLDSSNGGRYRISNIAGILMKTHNQMYSNIVNRLDSILGFGLGKSAKEIFAFMASPTPRGNNNIPQFSPRERTAYDNILNAIRKKDINI